MTVLQAVLDVIQAITVIAAAIIGAWGLNTWRREMIGRKKADLAEQTLALFYQAGAIIKAARFPAGFSDEGQTRPRDEGESESEAQHRNAANIPAERLFKESEFFARLEALRYRFMALFGTEAAGPFDAIKAVRDQILRSSYMLMHTDRERIQEREDLRHSCEEWERDIGYRRSKSDALAGRMEAAIAEVERTCQASLTGKQW